MGTRTGRLVLAALFALASANASGSIIHRYLMDDGSGTNVADSVSTDHGTAKGGGGGWTSGKFGGAWDGTSNGFISFPYASAPIPTTQGSFVQWAKISTAAGNWVNPLTSHFIDAGYIPYPLRHEIGGPTPCQRAYAYGIPNGPGAGAAYIATTTVVKDNAWHQWATTYDNSTGRAALYVDGVQRGSTASFNPAGVVVNPTWLVGARYETGGGRCPGVYDNTAVYNHPMSSGHVWETYHLASDGVTVGTGPALDPGPLRHLYTFGAGSHPQPTLVVDSRSGYNGLVQGGSWVGDNPPENQGGWQKTSTASGNYALLPIQANVQQGTYEGWFKSQPNIGDWVNPLSTSIRSLTEPHWADSMRIELTTSGKYGYHTNVYDAPGAGTITTDEVIADGLWHHLALVYEDGEKVKLYIDGALAGQSPSNYAASLAYDRGMTMLGCRDIGATTAWRGTVGTLGYYDIALSEESIRFHYNAGIQEALIPEPTTIGLLLVGLGAGLVRRRRRQS